MNKEIEPVLNEISALLKKHDMVGLFMVGNRTHVDYRMEIEASWSCAWLEEGVDGQMLRIRSKLADYPSKEAQKETMEATVGVFVSFTDVMERLKSGLESILVMISKNVDFIGKSTLEDGR